jgi:hypothetical protein
MMETIIDIDLNHSFWPNLAAAREAAAIQAANTGAVVVTVESVEIHPHQVITFVNSQRSMISSALPAPR